MKPETYRKRLEQKSTKWLTAKAVESFNAFIRYRDRDQPCISCGQFRELQAGHFYSAGHHRALRFIEKNVNGQCKQCNYFLRGNLIPYRENLIRKYGLDVVEKLDLVASMEKRAGHYKVDRLSLIEIIMAYRKYISLSAERSPEVCF